MPAVSPPRAVIGSPALKLRGSRAPALWVRSYCRSPASTLPAGANLPPPARRSALKGRAEMGSACCRTPQLPVPSSKTLPTGCRERVLPNRRLRSEAGSRWMPNSPLRTRCCPGTARRVAVAARRSRSGSPPRAAVLSRIRLSSTRIVPPEESSTMTPRLLSKRLVVGDPQDAAAGVADRRRRRSPASLNPRVRLRARDLPGGEDVDPVLGLAGVAEQRVGDPARTRTRMNSTAEGNGAAALVGPDRRGAGAAPHLTRRP